MKKAFRKICCCCCKTSEKKADTSSESSEDERQEIEEEIAKFDKENGRAKVAQQPEFEATLENPAAHPVYVNEQAQDNEAAVEKSGA